nr:TetR family transcriptional regulator C-terminal domain-containing protein [Kineosporia babensis]
MRFTLGALTQRALERAASRTLSADPATRISDLVRFSVPFSEQERRENIAFVEYRVLARTDRELAADIAAVTTKAKAAVESLLRDVLVGQDVDDDTLRRETLHLYSVIEGLCFSAAQQPTPLAEADVRAVAETFAARLGR